MIFSPVPGKGLEVYVDANFAGGPRRILWTQTCSILVLALLFVMHLVLFLWMRKLQTEMALSTAGAEYITRSQALRETKPLMNLM